MSDSQRKIRSLIKPKGKIKNAITPAQALSSATRDPFTISKEDFEVFENATDTYLVMGEKVSTVRYKHRDKFLKEHPLVAKLLEREGVNPLLREGAEIDRKGEHYFTYEILALLIHLRIIEAQNTHKPTYVFVHDNDERRKQDFIRSINLKDGDDVLLVSVTKIHATFEYIYQDKDITKSIYVDSEPGFISDSREILESVFEKTKTYKVDVRLQKDYFSCATFVAKLSKHCVKHRKEIFDSLDKTAHSGQNETKSDNSHRKLDLKDLPAVWRKMSQTTIYDAEEKEQEISQQIVSVKSKKNLNQYLRENELLRKDKKINIAAAIKKYKYLDVLERWLEKQLNAEEQSELSAIGYVPLPAKLDKIIHNLGRVPKQKRQNSLEQYKSQAEKLYKLFDSHDSLRPNGPIELGEFNYLNTFMGNIRNYRDLYNDLSPEKFKFFLFLLIARHAEDKHNYLDFAQMTADKFFRLFESYDEAIQYLNNNADFSAKQPIHDACLFELPKPKPSWVALEESDDARWNTTEWRKLVNAHGEKVVSYLALAPKIEAEMKKENLAFADLSPEKIKQLRNQCAYKNSSANPDMADMCLKHNVQEHVFDLCLDVMRVKLKAFDILPDITIRGEDLKNPHKRLKFKKLDPKDWRGLRLGDYTGCCQSAGNQYGHSCAIHGMTSPYSSFYVVVNDKDQIVAQSWTWMGKDGTVVFDSIESKGKNHDSAVIDFFLEAADKLIAEGARAVYLGSGGNTPVRLNKALQRVKPVKMISKNAYTDASEQLCLKSKDPENFQTLLRSSIGRFSPSEVKIDEAQKSFSILTSLPADDIYQISLILFRSGFHLFEELSKLYEITMINQLIEKMNSQQVVNLLELMDPITQTPFLHRLTKTELSQVRAVVLSKIENIPMIPSVFKEAVDAENNNFLHVIAQSDKVKFLKLCPSQATISESKPTTTVAISGQSITNDALLELLKEENTDGMNPLMVAAKHRATNFITQLLERVKDEDLLFELVTHETKNGNSFLTYLAENKLYDVLFQVIDRVQTAALSSKEKMRSSYALSLIFSKTSKILIDTNDISNVIKLVKSNKIDVDAFYKDVLKQAVQADNVEIFRAVYASDPTLDHLSVELFGIAIQNKCVDILNEFFSIGQRHPYLFSVWLDIERYSSPLLNADQESILMFAKALDKHPELQLSLFGYPSSSYNNGLFFYCITNNFDQVISYLCEKNKGNKENLTKLFRIDEPKAHIFVDLFQANARKENDPELTNKTSAILESYCDHGMMRDLFMRTSNSQSLMIVVMSEYITSKALVMRMLDYAKHIISESKESRDPLLSFSTTDRYASIPLTCAFHNKNPEIFNLVADFYAANFNKQEMLSLLLELGTPERPDSVLEIASRAGICYVKRVLELCDYNVKFSHILSACKESACFDTPEVLEYFLTQRISGVDYPPDWQKTLCTEAWNNAGKYVSDGSIDKTVIEVVLQTGKNFYTADELRQLVLSHNAEGFTCLQSQIQHALFSSNPSKTNHMTIFLSGMSRVCGDDKTLLYDLMKEPNNGGKTPLDMLDMLRNSKKYSMIMTFLFYCPPDKRQELIATTTNRGDRGEEVALVLSLLERVKKMEYLLLLKHQLAREVGESKLLAGDSTLFPTQNVLKLKTDLDKLLDPILDKSKNVCYEKFDHNFTLCFEIDRHYNDMKHIPIVSKNENTEVLTRSRVNEAKR
ncbi:MAG: hypothetical protein ABI597_10750 [Gammaproteobacteria bacterium]